MPNFQKRTDTIEAVNFRGIESLVEVARLCNPTKVVFTKTDKEPAILSLEINGKGYTICAGDWLCIKTEPPYEEHTGVFFVISDDQFRAQYQNIPSSQRFVYPETVQLRSGFPGAGGGQICGSNGSGN